MKNDKGGEGHVGRQLRTAMAIWLALQISIGSAASPAIGVASAKGSFDLDASKTAGNGTLFEGSTVETGKASSELKMANGVRMTLDVGTRGKVYRDHLLLEKGTGQINNGGTYQIRARSLQIQSSAGGQAKVTLTAGNRVLVAALTSPVRVTNASGMLIAELSAGRALEMEPQAAVAGAAAPSTLSGCLVKKAGHYTLTDETAGITAELQGSGLEKEVGNRIEVTGAMDTSATPVAGATQVIRASQVKQLGKRCSATAAKGAAAAGAAGAGAGAAGAGAGAAGAAGAATAGAAAAGITATTAVVAGVVVAGAAAGVAVGVTREDKTDISQ